MARHKAQLALAVTDITVYAIGIAACNIEKFSLAGSLIIRHCALYHMTEVIEFVAEVFDRRPTLLACPRMRMRRVLGSGGIEIAVGL